jgi:hypothetical protein
MMLIFGHFFTEPNTAYDTRMYTTKVYCYNVEIYLTCCERHWKKLVGNIINCIFNSFRMVYKCIQVALVQPEQYTLTEHLSSPHVLVGFLLLDL